VARGTTSDKLTLARIEARITQLERAKKDLDSLKGWSPSGLMAGGVLLGGPALFCRLK
jgi:hypothetical protein